MAARVGVILANDSKQRVRRMEPKLAGYLVGKGKARLADAIGGKAGALLGGVVDIVTDVLTGDEEQEQPAEELTDTDDLVNKSYRDLLQMAREAGVTPEGRTKDDYIRALRAARTPIPRPDE